MALDDQKIIALISTGYAFLKAHVEVATTISCQQKAYETHARMLDGSVGMKMTLLTISYVRLAAGLRNEAREAHEY